jgi:hypothetical protein
LLDWSVLYVGQSRDVYKRHREHTRDTQKNKQPIDKKICLDLRRYVLHIEEICNESELNELEKFYIEEYSPPYNCTKGGDYNYQQHINSKGKYILWDTSKVYYVSHLNQNRSKPFRLYYYGYYVPIGYFEDPFTVELIWEIIDEEAKK